MGDDEYVLIKVEDLERLKDFNVWKSWKNSEIEIPLSDITLSEIGD